jgi:hypothetical protein
MKRKKEALDKEKKQESRKDEERGRKGGGRCRQERSKCITHRRKKPWWVFPFSLANGGLAGSPSTSNVWVEN